MLDRIDKPLVFLLCAAPFLWLVIRAFTGQLGANPIEAMTRGLGSWGLIILLVTLCATPVRVLFKWPRVMRWRRMLGLFAFAYVALHVLSYAGLDHTFHWPTIWSDIVKRIYITIGLGGLLLLIPLAITSTRGWMMRLGGKAWQNLHKLIYPAAILGVVHYFFLVKADISEPMLFAAALAVLLGWRLHRKLTR
ncbi:MAG: sulfite oxidase heme-binding subunit YedZ [Rhodospirillaceae bacterium]